jgi:hypothetical protein
MHWYALGQNGGLLGMSEARCWPCLPPIGTINTFDEFDPHPWNWDIFQDKAPRLKLVIALGVDKSNHCCSPAF